MNRYLLAAVVATLCVAPAQAQQIKTYTQSQTGPQFLTFGLPVPLPIESLTPVDGFRSYASVQARLQELALQSSDLGAHDVGRSFAGRTVWAYVASDENDTDVEGRPEAAFFINASTHAREWGTPEVSTGTIERLVAGAGDGGIVRYVLDNTRLVIIPVQNVDGVLQTQRYPTDVLVGQDPDVPAEFPRDGRMRRKNMRGVDEVLTTTGDHLFGVDLNRNHPPFWATEPSRSSPNANSIVHHGAAPHSEPENQAILTAARLAPETRLRLGIDLHSFSRVFYTSNTARTRLNTIQRNLVSVMADHHQALSGARYDDVPDPANRGIGAAAEYFGYQWLVPSWTLELEPRNSAADYGGTNVTHGGFILPASEARRVRESWAETHLVAFYRMAGPPHLARVRYVDAQSGAVAAQVRWQWNPQAARRERVVDVAGPLAAGRRYRVELGFSKPMRFRNAAGQVAALPGTGTFPPLLPAVTLVQGATRTTLDIAAGAWVNDPARVLRYRDDTFAFEFDAPASGESTLEVNAQDMTGLNLDADPSSAVDWAEGAWSEYENVLGQDGDLGGPDRSTSFTSALASLIVASAAPALAGEGDFFDLDVELPGPAASTFTLAIARGTAFETLATWIAGSGDRRRVRIHLDDDAVAQGDRDAPLVLYRLEGATATAVATVPLRVLDNDSATQAVVRVTRSPLPDAGFPAAAVAGVARVLVLDRNDYYGPDRPESNCVLTVFGGPLRVHGNGATMRPGRSSCGVAVGFDGERGLVELLDLGFSADGETYPFLGTTRHVTAQTVLQGQGALALQRTRFSAAGVPAGGTQADTVLLNASNGNVSIARSRFEQQDAPDAPAALRFQNVAATLDRSWVRAVQGDTLVAARGGSVAVRSSTLEAPGTATAALALSDGATASWRDSLVQAPAGTLALCLGASGATSEGNNLFSDAGCAVPAASDRVLRVPLAYNAVTQRYDVPVAARDAIAPCNDVDLRGAPRPQSPTGGIVPPRCDIGALEAGINPYRGIWAPQRPGHGVDIQTTGNTLFLAWYTYGADGEPTAYQASGPFTGPSWEATLQQSSRNPQTGVVSLRDVGRVFLLFRSDTHAEFGWQFQDQLGSQEEIRASEFASGDPRFEVTGLWYPPANPGHGATISRRGEVTAIGVYYYDAQGNVRWALGTGTGADAQRFAMTSFRGFCPDCNAIPVTGTPAGSVLAHFHTPQQARLDMELTYPGAAGGQWNRGNERFVPLNDPVDNRDALGGD